MSGMKFRHLCADCNATFFSEDRKARYCPKCLKKHSTKRAAEQAQPAAPRGLSKLIAGSGSVKAAEKPSKQPVRSPPKTSELTPELLERVGQIYREQYANSEILPHEFIAKISDSLWLNRKAVGAAIHRIRHPQVEVTPEMEARVIGMYTGFVTRGERPAEGRRKTIGRLLGIPFWQVRNIVYSWSRSEYAKSSMPEHSREQKFEIEKLYSDELNQQRSPLSEIPEQIARKLDYATTYQVQRWLDKLHDDDHKFEHVTDLPQDVEERIIETYRQYLASEKPPEQGLHSTIARQIGEISSRQVHKVLQMYRKKLRAEYPIR